MSQIAGTKVAGQLTVGDPSISPYGTHYSFLGTGGYHEVLTTSDRDSIPVGSIMNDDLLSSGRRRLGMQVYVIEENKIYTLGAGVTASSWTALTLSQRLTYLTSNANWTVSSTITGAPLSKILFVNANGYAGTPEKGNPFKPYQHPNTAKADMVDGDYALVLGGTYTGCNALSVPGAKVTWDLRSTTLVFPSNQAVVNHGSLDSTTYIFGTSDSKISKVGNTAAPIVGLTANSIVHINIGTFEAQRSSSIFCLEFIFNCEFFNWTTGSGAVFAGIVPANGFVKISGKFRNTTNSVTADLIQIDSADNTAVILLKDVIVEDNAVSTSGFGSIRFSGTNDPLLLLDNVSTKLKSTLNFSIDAGTQTNARVKILSPCVVDRPWGTASSGTFSFSGSTIQDIVSGVSRDGGLQVASKLVSTDSTGNRVQQYQVDNDPSFSANSDDRLSTQKAIKLYIDSNLPAGNAGVKIRGSFEITTNPAEYPKALSADAVNATQMGDGSTVVTAAKASGFFHIGGISTGDTFIVNGTSFVAGTDFTVGVGDGFTVNNLVIAINTSVAVNTIIKAIDTYSTDLKVVIEALSTGTTGNTYTLGVSPGGSPNTASGLTLTGGHAASTHLAIGDSWFVKNTPSGTVGPTPIATTDGDLIICLVPDATNIDTDWLVLQANLVAATESNPGVAEIATDVETQAETDNSRIVSPLKLGNWWTYQKTLPQTFADKLTLTTAPRLSSTTANSVLGVNGTKDLISYIFDNDNNLTANSATRVPTQQAVKGYADNHFVPLAGTVAGKPITGDLEFNGLTGAVGNRFYATSVDHGFTSELSMFKTALGFFGNYGSMLRSYIVGAGTYASPNTYSSVTVDSSSTTIISNVTSANIKSSALFGAGQINLETYGTGSNTSAARFTVSVSLPASIEALIETTDSVSGLGSNVRISPSEGVGFSSGLAIAYGYFKSTLLTANHTYEMPDDDGTLALLSDIPSLTGYLPLSAGNTQKLTGDFYIGSDKFLFMEAPTLGPDTLTMGYGVVAGTDSFGLITSFGFIIAGDNSGFKYTTSSLGFGISKTWTGRINVDNLSAHRAYQLPDISGKFFVDTDDISIITVGKGLKVKSGVNCKLQSVTLNGTTPVVVSNNSVTSNSIPFLSESSSTNFGQVSWTISSGVSITFVSTNASDIRTIYYLIVESI